MIAMDGKDSDRQVGNAALAVLIPLAAEEIETGVTQDDHDILPGCFKTLTERVQTAEITVRVSGDVNHILLTSTSVGVLKVR